MLILGVSALLFSCGCGSEVDKSPENPSFSNLGGIAEIYLKYMSLNGSPPKDVDQFKNFANDRGGYTLNRLRVKQVDDLLVSQRDGQPFVLMLHKPTMTYEDTPIIAYEAKGADGKRMVGLANGGAVLLTDAEFEALKPLKP